ncbi:MAG: rhodanese-like domain-containing protein [Actinomycetota bacterium]|nr:rhodanese-like domain-containing protein [Actinomycetota bacterium]
MNQLDALPTVSVDDAALAAAGGAVLLDVREYEEWMSGHAPTAIHIPMNDLPSRVGELDRTRRIVCICRSGNRSGRVTAWLLQQGFDAVNMAGGMFQWASFGHPMVNHAGNAGVVI